MTRDFPAQLSLVMVDRGLLEQALVNILENAIAIAPTARPVELAAYEDRGSVVISIEDEGVAAAWSPDDSDLVAGGVRL